MNPAVAALQPAVPLLVVTTWAVLVLIAEMFGSRSSYRGIGWLAVVGLAVFAYVSWAVYGAQAAPEVYAGALALDAFTVYVAVLAALLAALAVLMAMDHLDTAGVRGGEYYPLLLFAVVGIAFMAAATDLIVMFLGLEIMSMAVYVLAGMAKQEARSNEAALKYFMMGAFASAFLLYGIALVYAETGSTGLGTISSAAAAAGSEGAGALLLLGIALLIVGFGFKVAAVPFHLWTPDVYEGAPTSVTAFMSTTVKLGGFAAALRVLVVALGPVTAALEPLMWVVAAATMTVGNIVALRQTSLKRMLAYSSIAHTGYLFVGLTAGTSEAASAVLFYLASYGVVNLGAFGVMMIVSAAGRPCEDIRDFAGLGRSQPLLAAAMTVCMLSLTGIPPLGGFFGKVYLFAAAVDAGQVRLVVVAVLNSVVSAAYYLGVVRTMYFEDGDPAAPPLAVRPHLWVATATAVALTIALGLAPAPVLDAAAAALGGVVLQTSALP